MSALTGTFTSWHHGLESPSWIENWKFYWDNRHRFGGSLSFPVANKFRWFSESRLARTRTSSLHLVPRESGCYNELSIKTSTSCHRYLINVNVAKRPHKILGDNYAISTNNLVLIFVTVQEMRGFKCWHLKNVTCLIWGRVSEWVWCPFASHLTATCFAPPRPVRKGFADLLHSYCLGHNRSVQGFHRPETFYCRLNYAAYVSR